MARKGKQKQANALPLVAIDLGSNGVRAMAARRVDDDLFEILGVEESHKYPCVEQGVIIQSSNAGYMIGEVLHLLANRIHEEELPTAFVSLGGQSMQFVQVKAKRDQVRRRVVSRDLMDDMEKECKDKIERNNPDVAVLGLVPSYYVLDGVEQDEEPNPEQKAALVEAHYFAFYGKKQIDTQLQKSFTQANRSIEHSFVRPDALISAFACEDGNSVLEEGCAVLDMGAQTTTLTVYKAGQYLYNKVVPKGGYSVTRLLEQQGIAPKLAEQLKCKYGYATAAAVKKNLKLRVPASSEVGGELVVTSEELAYTISLKLEEIVNPLFEELNKFAERIGTLYLTGGASMMNGMIDYLQPKTSIRVQYGAHDMLLIARTDEKYFEPTYSSLVGTILMGQAYRDNHKEMLVPEPTIIDKLKHGTNTLFSDPDLVPDPNA